MTDPQTEPEVVSSCCDGIGRIVLNRPRAINALNHSMVGLITNALTQWADDDSVRAVVLTGAGDRGLCAGGDVSIYHDARDGGTGSLDFWRDEYTLNALIARYPKPYIAIMDGVVMGGGVGLSAHGNIRIVTERSVIAMPETGIGFVPDVGGTFLLARSPGELGTHIALTASRLDAGDAIACGFADHFIPSEKIEAFLAHLTSSPVQSALDSFTQQAPPSRLLGERAWIDCAYAADSVSDIVERLQFSDAPEAAKAAARVLANSPTACSVALRVLRRARNAHTLEHALDDEFRVASASLRSPDLIEGIRAQVIDKDRNPRWSPAELSDVTDTTVDSFFADLGELELGLTPASTKGTNL